MLVNRLTRSTYVCTTVRVCLCRRATAPPDDIDQHHPSPTNLPPNTRPPTPLPTPGPGAGYTQIMPPGNCNSFAALRKSDGSYWGIPTSRDLDACFRLCNAVEDCHGIEHAEEHCVTLLRRPWSTMVNGDGARSSFGTVCYDRPAIAAGVAYKTVPVEHLGYTEIGPPGPCEEVFSRRAATWTVSESNSAEAIDICFRRCNAMSDCRGIEFTEALPLSTCKTLLRTPDSTRVLSYGTSCYSRATGTETPLPTTTEHCSGLRCGRLGGGVLLSLTSRPNIVGRPDATLARPIG